MGRFRYWIDIQVGARYICIWTGVWVIWEVYRRGTWLGFNWSYVFEHGLVCVCERYRAGVKI